MIGIYLDSITHPDFIPRASNYVLSEIDLVVTTPVGCQSFQRFNSFQTSKRIDGGKYATGAPFYTIKLLTSYKKFVPGIFFVRSSTTEYQIGPKAIHGQRFGKASIKVSQ